MVEVQAIQQGSHAHHIHSMLGSSGLHLLSQHCTQRTGSGQQDARVETDCDWNCQAALVKLLCMLVTGGYTIQKL